MPTTKNIPARDVHGNGIPRGNGNEKQISTGMVMGMGMIFVRVGLLENAL